MIYIGIDPGVSGGIAMLSASGAILVAVKMPTTDRDVYDVFHHDAPLAIVPSLLRGDCVACIEKVHASPQMGTVSAFTFGRGYGALCMALTVAEIPFDLVTPQAWQKALGCLTGGDKNLSKARAQRRWPKYRPLTHAIADALLIAEYCRRFCAPSVDSSPRPSSQEKLRVQKETPGSGPQGEAGPQTRPRQKGVARPV